MAATTAVWKDTVTMGKADTPRKVADLYAPDATLWGTVSEEVRDTPEQIYAYFVSSLFHVVFVSYSSFGGLERVIGDDFPLCQVVATF